MTHAGEELVMCRSKEPSWASKAKQGDREHNRLGAPSTVRRSYRER